MPTPRAQATDSATAVVERPRAFYSYSHLDWESSVRLVEELKLRGFSVFRDVERMREGRPIENEMAAGIDESHLLMCLLTEDSLASTPVVESELKPALRKSVRKGLPVVMPVVVGLGSNHQEVTERTWPELQHDFSATWTGGILPNATNPLSLDDAASIAAKAVAAVFPSGRGPADGAWQLRLTTRGTPAAADGLAVDATSFLGGEHAEVGDPSAWERVHRGVLDLEHALRAHGRRREVELTGRAHLTAAVATGFIFRRPTGWLMSVRADDGELYSRAASAEHPALRITSQPSDSASSFITAEVNILGRKMDPLVDTVLASLGRPSLRLRVEHLGGNGYVACNELTAMASATAAAIKSAAQERHAETVRLFLAGPFAFGAFLGAELNAVGAFIQLYEWAEHAYHPSLKLESK